MKIIIRTKNIKLDDALEEFINDKIGSLDKFFKMLKDEKVEKGKPLGEFFVEIGKETKHHVNGPYFRAEVQIHLPGKSLRAEAESENLKLAIVEVKDEMQREIKKYKMKTIETSRRKSRKIKKELRGI